MGRFEDLVAQAREGDTEALDALEQEFSGSALREQAEEAGQYKAKFEKLVPLARKNRVEELVGKLPDDLKDVGLGAEDFGDFDPDSLTLEQVQDRAKAKSEQAQATRLAAAQEAGFDSVEEYQEALETVKQQKATRKQGMESVAGGVASSGGEPPGANEPSGRELAKEAFDASKEQGRTDDVALAASVSAILEAQMAQIEAE
jgi:hypothetical protein